MTTLPFAHSLTFITALYDYADPDEERMLWDDPSAIPSSIGTGGIVRLSR